jgi:hypothetical protein
MGNSLGMSGVPMRMGAGAGSSQGKLLDSAAAAAGMAGAGSSSSSTLPYTELLPAGCAADAYKLFVGNVPHAFTEEELRPVSGRGLVMLGAGAWLCGGRWVEVEVMLGPSQVSAASWSWCCVHPDHGQRHQACFPV